MSSIIDGFLRRKHHPNTTPGPLFPTRTRFDIERSYDGDHYGYTYVSTQLRKNPDGRALSSLLDNGQHAPVLDVDHPVEVTPEGGGRVVTFSGRWWFVPRVRRTLDALARTGLIESWGAYPALFTYRLWVRFGYEVVVLPSSTRRHHHLLAQTQMPWADAMRLASGLAAARIVDRRFSRVSGHGDFLYVEQPVTAHDRI